MVRVKGCPNRALSLPSGQESLLRISSVSIEHRANRLVAGLCVVAAGLDIGLAMGFRLGLVVSLASMVLWARDAGRVRIYQWLIVLVIAAAIAGALLTFTTSPEHSISSMAVLNRSLLLLGIPLIAGMMAWGASLLGVGAMTTLFGMGMLFGIPFHLSTQDNAWRFTYSVAVGIFVMAVTSYVGPRWLAIATLVILAVIGLLNDSRSNSAMLLLAAILVIAQNLSRLSTRRGRGVGAIVALGLSGLAIYWGLQGAILEGYFGESTRGRTEAQIEQSGSLLIGARPEMAASSALIGDHLFGLGSGTIASYDDILSAKTAMSATGYEPNNGYVEVYMFGGPIEVHSGLGDFWLWFGPLGAAAGILMVFMVLGHFGRSFSQIRLTPLMAYLTVRISWDMAVSPATSSVRLLTLGLALALSSRMQPPLARASNQGGPT